MIRLYEMLVRGLGLLPYGFSLNKARLCNVRCARNTIQLAKELGLHPGTLVDVGANNSQWAYWLHREWPQMEIFSFEPHPAFHPLGSVMRVALSDHCGVLPITTEGGASHLSHKGDTLVDVYRFDNLYVPLKKPAILKVDCETHTFRALAGFGDYLDDFKIIVVEMWNHYPHLPQFQNQQADIWELMLKYGKRNCRVVDCEWTAGDGVPVYDIAFY